MGGARWLTAAALFALEALGVAHKEHSSHARHAGHVGPPGVKASTLVRKETKESKEAILAEVAEHEQEEDDDEMASGEDEVEFHQMDTEDLHDSQRKRRFRGYPEDTFPQCLVGMKDLVGTNKIPNSYITASSNLFGSAKSVPTARRGQAGWCASRIKSGEWLSWHFQTSKVVTQIQMGGNHYYGHTTKFKLIYRSPYLNWTTYPEILTGNTAKTMSSSLQTLLPAIHASEVRIYPLKWEKRPCMSVELKGCDLIDLTAVQGYMGAPGRPGKKGVKGKKGPPGLDGVVGDIGLPGLNGTAGPPGSPGKFGSEGAFIDCVWGQWIPWTECTTSCGGGLQQRERGWDIYPQDDGVVCSGDELQTRQCATDACPSPEIDGNQTANQTVISLFEEEGLILKSGTPGLIPSSLLTALSLGIFFG